MASLCASLSTVTSPTLSEVVLELGRAPSEFSQPHPHLWGNWDEIDKLFEGFLDWRPGFKLVIRTGTGLCKRDEFEAQARERFPIMAMRSRIQFEALPSVDKYWSKCSCFARCSPSHESTS